MDAKELRIGNWIMDRGNKEWQINHWENSTKVSAKEPIIGICDFTKKPIYGHPLTEEVDFLKPIELTYQWLDKLGFEFKDAGDFGHYYSLEDFDLNQDYQPINFDCDEIKYVHQLQNVYFALTGQELEIK
jgi:hypothetical protein